MLRYGVVLGISRSILISRPVSRSAIYDLVLVLDLEDVGLDLDRILELLILEFSLKISSRSTLLLRKISYEKAFKIVHCGLGNTGTGNCACNLKGNRRIISDISDLDLRDSDLDLDLDLDLGLSDLGLDLDLGPSGLGPNTVVSWMCMQFNSR